MIETNDEGFLISAENMLAYTCILAMSEKSGVVPPIVLLRGPSGVGKSALLELLVRERLRRHTGDSAALVTGDAFSTECSEADDRPGGWSELRERYRRLDLLALDDLQGLKRNPLAVNELLHTLDALESRGASIAVTLRNTPGFWRGWPRALVSRFLAGLSVMVEVPSLETRRRFLLESLRRRSLLLSAEAVEYLAESADRIPTLNGWLNYLERAVPVRSIALSRARVELLITREELGTGVTIPEIAKAVARAFSVSLRDLRGPSRRPIFVEPRHYAIHLARRYTGAGYARIGQYFGRRDAKTIRHACAAAAARLDADPAAAALLDALSRPWKDADSLELTA
ncbi:MAG: DnaA/Hda family protein [Isosphaeraceae bacterium]|nr:DnaA/Hda family protein [Isosphaeraceae bacterium]